MSDELTIIEENGPKEIVSSSMFEMLEKYSDTELEKLFERRSNILKVVRSLALKNTNPADWIDQQGKPYLASSGAEKVAAELGVSWREIRGVKTEKKDAKGEYYAYEFKGVFSFMNRSIEAVGTCNSRDQFFQYFNEYQKDENGNSIKVRKVKPIEDIDEDNIKKASYTNCLVNGITRILGLRNLTWAELEKHGIRMAASQKVEYGKDKEKKSYPASKAQTDYINNLLRNFAELAEKDRHDMVERVKTSDQAKTIIECLKKEGVTLDEAGKLFEAVK